MLTPVSKVRYATWPLSPLLLEEHHRGGLHAVTLLPDLTTEHRFLSEVVEVLP